MECGHCIFERLRNEGVWDRFGTTVEEEIEAMCLHHLVECEELYRKDAVSFAQPELALYADKLAAERKRREVTNSVLS